MADTVMVKTDLVRVPIVHNCAAVLNATSGVCAYCSEVVAIEVA